MSTYVDRDIWRVIHLLDSFEETTFVNFMIEIDGERLA